MAAESSCIECHLHCQDLATPPSSVPTPRRPAMIPSALGDLSTDVGHRSTDCRLSSRMGTTAELHGQASEWRGCGAPADAEASPWHVWGLQSGAGPCSCPLTAVGADEGRWAHSFAESHPRSLLALPRAAGWVWGVPRAEHLRASDQSSANGSIR